MSAPDPLAHDESGSGPLLVAVHGITEDRTYWDPVPLAEHHRVLRVDLPGHGESAGRGPFDADGAADEIHALLRARSETETPVLLGHSLGGVVATIYASRFPSRGVVNVDQVLDVAPFPDVVADTVRGGDVRGLLASMFAGLYGDLDPTVAADLERRRTVEREVLAGYYAPLLEQDERQVRAWIRSRTDLPDGLPYLALHGFAPDAAYRSWLAERIPSAVVETSTTSTHYPQLAEPTGFAERIHRFTARSALSAGRGAR